MDWDYENMLEMVLLSFMERQNQTEAVVDFSVPVLADTIAELNKARELPLDKGMKHCSEGDIYWDSEIVGKHSLFYYSQGSSAHSINLWNERVLPAFVLPRVICTSIPESYVFL